MKKSNQNYKLHKQQCKKIFEHAMNEDIIYACMDEIEEYVGGNIENPKIRFSIITEQMLEYDKEMAERIGYRPYFFSFVADYNDAFCKKIKKEHPEEGGDEIWFKATFREDVCGENVRWNLDGEVEYASSPIQYKKLKLYIIAPEIPEDIRDDINRTYPLMPKNDSTIDTEFNNVFSDVQFNNATIYKVGHANLIRFRGNKSGGTGARDRKYFSFLYDIGWPRKSSRGYLSAKKALGFMRPKAVVLSHWDTDHIMGIVHANNSVFDCPWFAPEITGGRINARRLACFLSYKGILNMVRRRKRAEMLVKISGASGTYEFTLYCGINKRISGVTTENCGGLVITYQNNGVKSIFCGDVPYEAIEKVLWSAGQKYDYLIIPHHARRMKVDPIVCSVKPDSSIGIYCSDIDGDLGHIAELEAKEYKVYKTEDACKLGFRIELGSKGTIKNL